MNAGFLLFSLKEDTKPLEMIISDLNKRIDELNGAGHRIENEFVVLASLPQKREIIARKVIPVRWLRSYHQVLLQPFVEWHPPGP
jgi:hypothetical protein